MLAATEAARIAETRDLADGSGSDIEASADEGDPFEDRPRENADVALNTHASMMLRALSLQSAGAHSCRSGGWAEEYVPENYSTRRKYTGYVLCSMFVASKAHFGDAFVHMTPLQHIVVCLPGHGGDIATAMDTPSFLPKRAKLCTLSGMQARGPAHLAAGGSRPFRPSATARPEYGGPWTGKGTPHTLRP